MKILFASICLTHLFFNTLNAQTIQYFPLSQVALLPSPFKHAQEMDKEYILSLDADRLLAPFLKEAGLPTDKPYYGNWESQGLSGHIGGHYLTALAEMYAATNDPVIAQKINYFLAALRKAQIANGNGYVGGVPNSKKLWKEVADGNIRADAFSLNHTWVPLYNIHKIFAGLRDAYLYTGNPLAKQMWLELTDWAYTIFGHLSKEQCQSLLKSEQGGLNEVFIDAYNVSKDQRYADLAMKFSDERILQPLLAHQDVLTGLHANTQIPKVIGFERIGVVLQKKDWQKGAAYFWDNVVHHRTVAFGGNSAFEHFNPTQDFSSMLDDVQGPETCNSNNMLKLTQNLYQQAPKSSYIDYFEEVLYNHILSSQDSATGGMAYFTNIRPESYRVFSQPQTSFWCCVGTGMENHAKYGEMIYAKKDNDLIVNLFIPSKLSWKEKNLTLTQQSDLLSKANSQLSFELKSAQDFTVFIRVPNWVNKNGLSIRINQQATKFYASNADGYVAIKRKWQNLDKVFIELPMQLSTEILPDSTPFYAFKYGPFVLASATDTMDQKGLFADDSRGGHIARGSERDFTSLPVLFDKSGDLMREIIPFKTPNAFFNITSITADGRAKNFVLQPFSTIQQSRYIMYWPIAKGTSVQDFRNNVLAKKDKALMINKKTIDLIRCGEQQSEIDHAINYSDSKQGSLDGIHFRNIGKGISYQLKNVKDAKRLYIKYLPLSSDVTVYISLAGLDSSVQIKKTALVNELILSLPQNKTNNQLQFKTELSDLNITEIRLLK